MNRSRVVDVVVWCLLVGLGVGARIEFRHLPNFKPVAALALFAGYYFALRFRGRINEAAPASRLESNFDRSTAVALTIPLCILGFSDLVLGGYDIRLMLVVYGMLAAPVFAGPWLRRSLESVTSRTGATSAVCGLVVCSLAGSLAFFLVTNFACWFLDNHYERSWAGLATCYASAIPFFRYTLGGDLIFGFLTFGAHNAVVHCLARRQARRFDPAVPV